MSRAPKTRDGRLAKKKTSRDIATLITDVMEGRETGRPGAESAFMLALKLLVQAFLLDEGTFADALRTGVAGLMNKADELRRDIPPDAWATIWPALNSLQRARAQALVTLAQANKLPTDNAAPPEEATHGSNEEAGSEGGSETGSEEAPGGGAGVLGAGRGRAGRLSDELTHEGRSEGGGQ